MSFDGCGGPVSKVSIMATIGKLPGDRSLVDSTKARHARGNRHTLQLPRVHRASVGEIRAHCAYLTVR